VDTQFYTTGSLQAGGTFQIWAKDAVEAKVVRSASATNSTGCDAEEGFALTPGAATTTHQSFEAMPGEDKAGDYAVCIKTDAAEPYVRAASSSGGVLTLLPVQGTHAEKVSGALTQQAWARKLGTSATLAVQGTHLDGHYAGGQRAVLTLPKAPEDHSSARIALAHGSCASAVAGEGWNYLNWVDTDLVAIAQTARNCEDSACSVTFTADLSKAGAKAQTYSVCYCDPSGFEWKKLETKAGEVLGGADCASMDLTTTHGAACAEADSAGQCAELCDGLTTLEAGRLCNGIHYTPATKRCCILSCFDVNNPSYAVGPAGAESWAKFSSPAVAPDFHYGFAWTQTKGLGSLGATGSAGDEHLNCPAISAEADFGSVGGGCVLAATSLICMEYCSRLTATTADGVKCNGINYDPASEDPTTSCCFYGCEDETPSYAYDAAKKVQVFLKTALYPPFDLTPSFLEQLGVTKDEVRQMTANAFATSTGRRLSDWTRTDPTTGEVLGLTLTDVLKALGMTKLDVLWAIAEGEGGMNLTKATEYWGPSGACNATAVALNRTIYSRQFSKVNRTDNSTYTVTADVAVDCTYSGLHQDLLDAFSISHSDVLWMLALKSGLAPPDRETQLSYGMEPDPPVFGVAPDFASVSAGGGHTCAQRVLGEPGVEFWGAVSSDDVDGSFDTVSSGTAHSCGLRPDGNVTCWGSDEAKADSPEGKYLAVSAGHSASCR
jgi:hypothetical protein